MLHFFRTLFVTNRDILFCTLRSELLMALHDQGVSDVRNYHSCLNAAEDNRSSVLARQIYDIDPCHKFAWCMDACVRDHIVEERRLKEMQTYFASVPAGTSSYSTK